MKKSLSETNFPALTTIAMTPSATSTTARRGPVTALSFPSMSVTYRMSKSAHHVECFYQMQDAGYHHEYPADDHHRIRHAGQVGGEYHPYGYEDQSPDLVPPAGTPVEVEPEEPLGAAHHEDACQRHPCPQDQGPSDQGGEGYQDDACDQRDGAGARDVGIGYEIGDPENDQEGPADLYDEVHGVRPAHCHDDAEYDEKYPYQQHVGP